MAQDQKEASDPEVHWVTAKSINAVAGKGGGEERLELESGSVWGMSPWEADLQCELDKFLLQTHARGWG